MYGAIIGDIIGSPFEFDAGSKSKEFELFCDSSIFTDDTVMTVAVAEALLAAGPEASGDEIRSRVVRAMRRWGRSFPNAGYGGRFRRWLTSRNPAPYHSFGNGSAMRVSAVGWLYDTLERTREVARATADVTHDHPEGIKGAEAAASVIYLARTGRSKGQIMDYMKQEFHYDLSRTIDQIRPTYHHVESCQETVPEAITAFLEGTDFEDVVRTAVSLGGDCDTLTDIAAAMAEAFYGMPEALQNEVRSRVAPEMLNVLSRFDSARKPGRPQLPPDSFLSGNEMIETGITRLAEDESREAFAALMTAIHTRMLQNGHLILPARDLGDEGAFEPCTVQSPDGQLWMTAFTSAKEYACGEQVGMVLSHFIDRIFDAALKNDGVAGLVINPWGQSLTMPKELLKQFFNKQDESSDPMC